MSGQNGHKVLSIVSPWSQYMSLLCINNALSIYWHTYTMTGIWETPWCLCTVCHVYEYSMVNQSICSYTLCQVYGYCLVVGPLLIMPCLWNEYSMLYLIIYTHTHTLSGLCVCVVPCLARGLILFWLSMDRSIQHFI